MSIAICLEWNTYSSLEELKYYWSFYATETGILNSSWMDHVA